jgi:release factor glutamine methyltransferase
VTDAVPGTSGAPVSEGDDDATVSWRQLLAETAGALGDRQHAWWMCEVASGFDGAELTAAMDAPATVRAVAHLDTMVARRRAGEPLQYVLGRWGFRRLDLAIDRRVLIPRPETEMVVDVALELLGAHLAERLPITLADLGTGSGAIGLALADELPLDGTTVWITDVDEAALHVARANLAGIGRPATNVRVAAGSWFAALDPDSRFDLIVANPPYIADGSDEVEQTVAEHEPAEALFAGPDGLDALRVIIDGAPRHLVPGGWLVVEIGADQGRAVEALFAASGFRQVVTRRDLAGRDRVVLGRTGGQ